METISTSALKNMPFISTIIGTAFLSGLICIKLTRFYARFEKNERILFENDRVLFETVARLDRMEAKLDLIVQFLLKGKPRNRASNQLKDPPQS
jgi:uncharacterized coiled-coil protein SlyX